MDKQRLLQLAGIVTEAKYAGAGEHWIVANLDDTGHVVAAYGPFPSEDAAESYVMAYAEEQDYDVTDLEQFFHVCQVYPPENL